MDCTVYGKTVDRQPFEAVRRHKYVKTLTVDVHGIAVIMGSDRVDHQQVPPNRLGRHRVELTK